MGGLFQNNNLSVGTLKAVNQVLPTDFSTLFFWFDAADLTTITASANAISTWSDKSGGGRNFTQGTVGSRPTYQASSFNGRPSVNFDGVDDFMTYASNTSYSRFTVFAVLNVQNNTTEQIQDIFSKTYFYALGTNDFPFRGITAGPTVVSLGSSIDGGGNYVTDFTSTSSASPNVNYLFTSYYDQTNLITSINGVTGQTIPATITLSSTLAPYAIGRAGAENGGGVGGSYYKGNIAELIYYTSSLSAAQQASIRTYLGNKWGISTL